MDSVRFSGTFIINKALLNEKQRKQVNAIASKSSAKKHFDFHSGDQRVIGFESGVNAPDKAMMRVLDGATKRQPGVSPQPIYHFVPTQEYSHLTVGANIMHDMDPPGVEILALTPARYRSVLSPEALTFIRDLAHKFEKERQLLLQKRQVRQAALNTGRMLNFLPQTQSIREGKWRISPLPTDLKDRRLELTGPVDRKMMINALNSREKGVKVFMADFEDSNAPTWDNLMEGQINLRDAVNGTMWYQDPVSQKHYQLKSETATLMVRPRGWHMDEKHVLIDGKPISAALFDFGLYFFHNAKNLMAKGSGPYFYLPKMESHEEARLWNSVFVAAQKKLGIPQGTVKATVLVETLPAAFEMDEILYELRNHSAGLNCGRWDYLFSAIKKFRNQPDFMLGDSDKLTMTLPFMRAYSQLAIKTAHRRGAPAIGGMAAQIPVKNDPEANAAAVAKVKADKEREANDGHDGTWIAHPDLAPVALEAFNAVMPGPNQIHRKRKDVNVTAADLQNFNVEPRIPTTEAGVRTDISISLRYMAAWLGGKGAVALEGKMEDAATAEIRRSRIWLLLNSPLGKLDDGRKVTRTMVKGLIAEELAAIKAKTKPKEVASLEKAAKLFAKLVFAKEFAEFLTTSAYEMIRHQP